VKSFPRRDIRRICKHLYSKIIELPNGSVDSLTLLLIDTQFWLGQTELIKVSTLDSILFLGFDKSNTRLFIYHKNVDWDLYKFDLFQFYWRQKLHEIFKDDTILINTIIKIVESKFKGKRKTRLKYCFYNIISIFHIYIRRA
jgi:hypothetical protein